MRRPSAAPHGRRWVAAALLATLIVSSMAGCGMGDSDDEIVDERDGPAQVTPAALDEVPLSVGEATIHIAAGALEEELVILQEEEPTVLHVVNRDATAYRLSIVEDLVTPTELPAATTTDVRFTTPNPAVYEGRLLPAEGDAVLDTMVVRVQAPGSVQP